MALVNGSCCQRDCLPHCSIALMTMTIELNVQQQLHFMPSIDPALRSQICAFLLDKLLFLSVFRKKLFCCIAVSLARQSYSNFAPQFAISGHCTRQQGQTAWRPLTDTLDILTTCFSIVPTSILSVPRAICGPLLENMTSSTKLQVHNIFHCQQRTKP